MCPALDHPVFASLQTLSNFISPVLRSFGIEQEKHPLLRHIQEQTPFFFLHLGNSFYSGEEHPVLVSSVFLYQKKSRLTSTLFNPHIAYSVCELDASIYKGES